MTAGTATNLAFHSKFIGCKKIFSPFIEFSSFSCIWILANKMQVLQKGEKVNTLLKIEAVSKQKVDWREKLLSLNVI